MKIAEFAFVIYPSTDLERSRAFYEGLLGLTPAMSMDLESGYWVEYEIGPYTLAIGKESFLKPSGDGPHVALEVENFEAAIEQLRNYSVPFALEPIEMPTCRAAIVIDPDGNKLGIHQRKA
jgi:catechol 2,3-dioxygenase-like lactoylglutathione lyase family enzyme